MTLCLYRPPSTLHDASERQACWTMTLVSTECFLLYTMIGNDKHVGLKLCVFTDVLLLYAITGRTSTLAMNCVSTKTASTLHDDMEGQSHWTKTLCLYRRPSILHDDREGQARWTMTLCLYRLPSTLHDDRE